MEGLVLDATLLKKPKESRAALDSYLEPDEISAEAIKTTLKSKYTFLKSIDRFVVIDIQFWNSCVGESAKKNVEDAILQSLPCPERFVDMATCVNQLQELADSKLGGFMGGWPADVFSRCQRLGQGAAGAPATKD